MLNSTPTGRPPTNDTEEPLQNPHLAWDTPLLFILTAHPLYLVHNYTYFTRAYIHLIRLFDFIRLASLDNYLRLR